jgi:thymidylate kinase
MAGKFIVFEGVDGSGTSTQAMALHDYLVSKSQKLY